MKSWKTPEKTRLPLHRPIAPLPPKVRGFPGVSTEVSIQAANIRIEPCEAGGEWVRADIVTMSGEEVDSVTLHRDSREERASSKHAQSPQDWAGSGVIFLGKLSDFGAVELAAEVEQAVAEELKNISD